MENFSKNILEKWKFQPILPWKSGNFEVKKLGRMENFGQTSWKSGNSSRFYLGKVEILGLKSLEKWKF